MEYLNVQEREEGGDGGCAHYSYDQDPRIPPMPERSKSGFHRPDRHCLHQARSTLRCWDDGGGGVEVYQAYEVR